MNQFSLFFIKRDFACIDPARYFRKNYLLNLSSVLLWRFAYYPSRVVVYEVNRFLMYVNWDLYQISVVEVE